MKDKKKLLQKIISGSRNVRFGEAVRLAEAFGFRLDRISGSHHIFVHLEIPELLNLQNVAGKAKPYQMKQLIKIVEKHNLRMETSE
jgi:predicted RNA binding protein YcfA (HicA-like mRNA interferase family)